MLRSYNFFRKKQAKLISMIFKSTKFDSLIKESKITYFFFRLIKKIVSFESLLQG